MGLAGQHAIIRPPNRPNGAHWPMLSSRVWMRRRCARQWESGLARLMTFGRRLRVLATLVAGAQLWLILAAAAAAPDPAFRAFLERLWPEASQPPYGVSRAVFDRALAGLTPDLSLPDLDIPGRAKSAGSGQAEFIRPPQAYLDEKQLAVLSQQGRTLAKQQAAALQRIDSEIGVAPAIVLAIWGRETAFGTYKLPHNAFTVLATQAYLGRRKDTFRRELLYALKMVEDRIATPAEMRASWAGAMGLTQFMPSEFYTSLKGLGGGRPDLFHSAPDALASAAYQLQQKGWVRGLPWGFEVDIPQGSDCALEGPQQARPLADWLKRGFRRSDGRTWDGLAPSTELYLMSPGGAFGPAFLVSENYKVIRRYNTSDLYATFVGTLADRIGGGPGFKRPWADIRQLTEREVAEIQERLRARGAAIEKLDGKTGSNTRAEIGAFQRRAGLAVDCWPTAGLLHVLRTSAASTGAVR
jgi:lytic murein transglycosylase